MLPIAQFVATLCCIVFAGAAIYVNLVEHPARMGCSTQIAATVWAPSYKRGTWMQAPLAIVSFLTGTASWLLGAGIGWLLLVTFTKLLGPRGARAVAAESLLLKHQLLISNRCRQRAPNLTTLDRFLIALTTLFVSPRRIPKLGALIKPATLFKFHKALVNRKYRLLFSSPSSRRRPGPKGPSAELIAAIIELKRRNPRFGCVRIAQQISYAFGVAIDKDVVRRVLAKHYRPGDSGTNGPSWLTFIGHVKDSLWSVDLFRCESILLHSHWALLVMDVCSRRVVGFGVERANIDGLSVCRMFNHAIAGQRLPKHVSTDHDPLFRFHRWLANLRVLAIEEVKSVPYAPVSHPFVERLIGTVRREYLDHLFGTRSTWQRSWTHSRIITTRIAFIARLPAPRQRNAPERPPALLLQLITTLGGRTVVAYFRLQSRLEHKFATDRAPILWEANS